MNIQKTFLFRLLTSGNVLLLLKLCVFLISSPPSPSSFQKLSEVIRNGFIFSSPGEWH